MSRQKKLGRRQEPVKEPFKAENSCFGKKAVKGGSEMILSDWLTVIMSVMAFIVLYLDKKIPRRYGGYIIPKKPVKFADNFPRFTPNGKIIPSKSDKQQAIIESLRTLFLWAIAVIAIVIFILGKLDK